MVEIQVIKSFACIDLLPPDLLVSKEIDCRDDKDAGQLEASLVRSRRVHARRSVM